MGEFDAFVSAEIRNVERTLEALREATSRREKTTVEHAATAAFLHSAYNGIENILRHLLTCRGIIVPRSESWHKDLLGRAAGAGIIPATLADRLMKYLAFRHFFVHSYGFMLDPRELDPLVEGMESLWTDFLKSVER